MKRLLLLIAMTLLVGCGSTPANVEPVEPEIDYKQEMQDLAILMLDGGVMIESATSLVTAVWYDAIHEKGYNSQTKKYVVSSNSGLRTYYNSFNTALGLLYADPEFDEKIQAIKDNRKEVESRMKALMDVPDEYKDQFSDLRNMYVKYERFASCAISPSGSYDSYSEDVHTADNEFIDCYTIMKLYFDY